MRLMIALLQLVLPNLQNSFRSLEEPKAENTLLRHQANVLRRRYSGKVRLGSAERFLLVYLCKLFPALLRAIIIVKPETVISWHRAGYRAWWRWKSRGSAERPTIELELRDIIRQMCRDNPLWGAPRIHGELMMLGFSVAQSTVSKYMVKRRGRPSQGWRTFLRNHRDGIVSVDLLTAPTIGFEWLYAFVILRHLRREIVRIAVTKHPTAEWLARQITEAFPWETAPAILVRDNDRVFGDIFQRRVRTMGTRDHPISPRSPWQNGCVERVIGSIRREYLDHVIVIGEGHLQRVLDTYADYYNSARTHLSLDKNAPRYRAIECHGSIHARPVLAGLHHHYARIK